MQTTRLSDPHFTQNDLISMGEAEEITLDIFEIFRQFLRFANSFGNSPKIETPNCLRYGTFKVENLRFTEEFRT